MTIWKQATQETWADFTSLFKCYGTEREENGVSVMVMTDGQREYGKVVYSEPRLYFTSYDFGNLTPKQQAALADVCKRYAVPYAPDTFGPHFSLPTGYVMGTVGPITIGISPDGQISS